MGNLVKSVLLIFRSRSLRQGDVRMCRCLGTMSPVFSNAIKELDIRAKALSRQQKLNMAEQWSSRILRFADIAYILNSITVV
jgi:hypothetical protein